MKYGFLISFYFFIFGNIYSQNVGGTIINVSSGEPVPDAFIQVSGSSRNYYSNEDGSFAFSVLDFPVELQISALGFAKRRIKIEEAVGDKLIHLRREAENLSEVILRGSIIPKKVQQTPVSVSVLTSEALERFEETNLANALGSVAGIYVHQGALNTNKLSIRGIGARSQYSTNRVKAYFEGIPISTAEGQTTLDDIDPEVVQRVEVIKGPSSSIYGAGLGGVINLYAAEPTTNGTKASAEATFGSFGLLKKTLKATHSSRSTNLFAAYNHLETDGFRENGAYDRKSISLHGQLNGNESNELSILAHFTKLKAFIPSSLNREQFENNPTSAASSWAASKGFESYDKGLLGFSYKHEFSSYLRNTTSVYMNFRDAYEPRPFDILKEDQIGTGARTKFNFETGFLGFESEFSVGAEYFQEWYDSATFENLYEEFPGQGSVAGVNLSNNSQKRSYYNLFGQWNLLLFENFTLETGLNVNVTNFQLTDLFRRDDIDQSGDYQFETILSPRIAAVYDLSNEKMVYASVSHGFSTPTVAETLTPEGLINTSLMPETGINYEIGFKGNWLGNKLYSEVALFSIQINDLIVAERVGQDQYIGMNAGKTNHNGMEFLLLYNFQLTPTIMVKPHFNLSLNFYEFEEFIDNGIDYSGKELPGVPDKTIHAGFDVISENGFAFYATFQQVGKIPLNDANSSFTESYSLFNVKTSYSLPISDYFDAEIFAGMNNIFSKEYAASIVPNSVGFGGAAPRYFYPGKPKNYFVGIELGYHF